MVYADETENAVYLWWDKPYNFTEGCYYRITLDDTTVVYTKEILFDFYNVDMSVKHRFAVDLLNEDGKVVGITEFYETFENFPKKTELNVTKPPYNVKGDGVTDCTDAINQAFKDCGDDKFVYFPLGTYYCKEIILDGNVKVVYDTGVKILDKKETGLC